MNAMAFNEVKFEKANKRVKELKDFYRHIVVFVVINGFLYLLKSGVLTEFLPKGFPTEPYYYDWINGNLVIWGLILAVHTAYVYRSKFTFFQKWEERQIQKYLDKDREETDEFK